MQSQRPRLGRCQLGIGEFETLVCICKISACIRDVLARIREGALKSRSLPVGMDQARLGC